jgi:hypothetical protein
VNAGRQSECGLGFLLELQVERRPAAADRQALGMREMAIATPDGIG